MLINETQTANLALPIEAFKAHLCLGRGFDEVSLQTEMLVHYVRAAIAAVEGRCAKILLERRFTYRTQFWAQDAFYTLPVAPVRSLESLHLIDRSGVRQLLSVDLYRIEVGLHGTRLYVGQGGLPPISKDAVAEVAFKAGYGSAWSQVPSDLAQATLLLATHFYEYRHEVTLTFGCMPFGVTSLLERYRPMRLGAGGRS